MNEKQEKWINICVLAFLIALLPPIWAVVSPYLGVTTGSVALICAGVFVAYGNRNQDAIKVATGFLMGDIWAVLALYLMDKIPFAPNVKLYLALFVLGAVAVILGSVFEKWVLLPAWLCGWAIGLTILAPVGISQMDSLPIQIGVSMLVGVFYVGVGVNVFQKMLFALIKKLPSLKQTDLR